MRVGNRRINARHCSRTGRPRRCSSLEGLYWPAIPDMSDDNEGDPRTTLRARAKGTARQDASHRRAVKHLASSEQSARCGGRTPANPPGEGLITDVPLTIDPFIPIYRLSIEFADEETALRFERYLKSGSGRALRAPMSTDRRDLDWAEQHIPLEPPAKKTTCSLVDSVWRST